MTCLKFSCYLGRMRRGDQVKIQMRSRLWQNTLIEAKVGSVLSTTAEVVPPSSVTEHNNDDNLVQIKLTANPRTTPKSGGGKVAAWIIIVSVLGGFLLFGLAGFALYRFGFFKRKRYDKDDVTEEEMTPMKAPSAEDNGK
ncbi:Itga7p [Desmophyllum pertusum]|uniref:Itga7p n=1 Tax=Desmophyllum pertusum TaxID=174260 RepID=A0A9X0D833_9CNID|nr:Itga7p [Desmophyllum pertusum]